MNVLAELKLFESESLPELPELPEVAASSAQNPPDQASCPAAYVILSAIEGHDFHATPAVRAKAALTDTGILFVAEGATSDVLVRSYIATLDRRKNLSDGKMTPYTEIRTVPYTDIQRLYSESVDGATGSAIGSRRTAEESQVTSMVAEASEERSSEVWVEVYDGTAEIHYRIAGDVERRFAVKPDVAERLIRTVVDAMSEATSDPHYDPTRDQTGRLAQRYIEGTGLHRVRVSTGPTDEGRPFMALRLHYDLGEPRSLVELGFTPEHEAMFENTSNSSTGIAILSGSTGHGKSTSLANYIGYRQKRDNCRRKIISLEDPPEIPIFGTIQKAVQRKGLDRQAEGQAWIAGFETLMRWNPDEIIAGELRLRETMDAALKSALTGHLTWGMLHAASATLIPARLQEAGIELGYLCDPEIFRLFSNQSLVAQLCPHCSITYSKGRNNLSIELTKRIEKHCTADTVRMRGPGCEHCYRGVLRIRTICAEVLNTDEAQLSVFRQGGARALRRYWVREQGGLTKTVHMIDKINAGLIDPVDAERVVSPLNADDPLWE